MPSRTRPRRRRTSGSDHGGGSDADATDGLLAATVTGHTADSGAPDAAAVPAMQVLFSRKTPRVKAIAIHPTRPWALVGLHSGSLRCYDLDHLLNPDTAGPGVVVNAEVAADGDHHHDDNSDDGEATTAPSAASGGLWNMTLSTEHYAIRGLAWCPQQPDEFAVGDDAFVVYLCRLSAAGEKPEVYHTFHNSMDYIRSVQYHPQKPLIVVAADDMDIQIYDWQKRIRVATASGHAHYVMRAVFHPTLPVIASASLDMCVGLWKLPSDDDLAADAAKQLTGLEGSDGSSSSGGCCGCLSNWFNPVGTALAVTRLSMGEAHERGLNWVEFSGSAASPRELATSSDDRTALLWSFGDDFVLKPLRRITRRINNISFIMPIAPTRQQEHHQRVYLTGGEYGTVDLHAEAGTMFPTPRFEDGPTHSERRPDSKDRFWTAALTPAADVIIAGHDAGFVGLRVPPCAAQGGFSGIQVPLAA